MSTFDAPLMSIKQSSYCKALLNFFFFSGQMEKFPSCICFGVALRRCTLSCSPVVIGLDKTRQFVVVVII